MSILSNLYFNICLNIRQHLPAQPCLLCLAPSASGVWCQACDDALPRLGNSCCPICALPTWKAAVCGQCLAKPPCYQRTVAVYAYSFPLNKLVLAMKYGAQLQLANKLADKLAAATASLPDCLVAMPLHPARLRERGFNQALQLARRAGRQLKLPVLAQACQRVRDTPSQSNLPLRERDKNMRKAFTCTSEVAGKHVAIVDDVMTTGATVNALACSLLQAGATEVSVWVLARTLPHRGAAESA